MSANPDEYSTLDAPKTAKIKQLLAKFVHLYHFVTIFNKKSSNFAPDFQKQRQALVILFNFLIIYDNDKNN